MPAQSMFNIGNGYLSPFDAAVAAVRHHCPDLAYGNLARTLEREAPGVAGSILEGLDEILTVSRLGLPIELRRSLALTNIIENMNGTVGRVSHNVKRWRDASMALRWTAAGLMEAAKGFRRLKARDQLPTLRDALQRHHANHFGLDETSKAA